MAIVCSSCDVTPPAGAAAGTACTTCGERLISVDTGDDLVGTRIDGRFEVLAPLGRGGMGVVYRAKQLSIGREVALKVLDRRIEKDVDSVKRFFREAKLAATLQHPNTVPIVDFGQHADGRLYLAMELIRGRTLHDEVNRVGAIPLERISAIGIQLCEALETAHDLEIVHRDLKLENVMLLDGKRDHVKILDFGLARSLADPSTAMTKTGLISGTPRYMPPEVGIDAAPPAPPQDMYSIGVMLAEMALGRALWTAPTIEALFTKKLDTEQSIADVPASIKPLVRSLLASDPAMRPTAGQTRQLLRDLEAARPALSLELDDDQPRSARPARAQSPLALEATTDINVVVETGTTPDPFAALDRIGTVSLDELPDHQPAVAPPPPAPTAPVGPPPGVEDHDPRFTVPAGSELTADQLHIDPRDLAQRSQKLAARRAPPPVVKKKSKAPAVLISLLLLGGLGGGGYYYWFHYRTRAQTPQRLDGPGISITITADRPGEIFVDGRSAGRTPVKLQVPQGTTPITITGPGIAGKQIVPDRDQTIELESVK